MLLTVALLLMLAALYLLADRCATEVAISELYHAVDACHHASTLRPIPAICERIVELDATECEAYRIGAWALLDLGDPNAARRWYESGIRHCPRRYELWHEYGFVYWWAVRKDPEAALPYLARAAHMKSPNYIKHTYAHCLTRCGKEDEAADEWRRILRLYPDDATARKHLRRLTTTIAASTRLEG